MSFCALNRSRHTAHISWARLVSGCSGCSGWTNSQHTPAKTASKAARWNELGQPARLAIQGVRDAVTAPPICPPILTMLENNPEDRPARSTETDQNELCDRYRAPAPAARMTPAAAALCACEPRTSKAAVAASASAAKPQRPAGSPQRAEIQSLSAPPARQQIVIERKGNIVKTALVLRFKPRTCAR